MDRGIVVVSEGGPHVWALVNALADRFGQITIILETPESKRALLTRRARKQGWASAVGQLGTMVLTRLGKRLFSGRAERLLAETGIDTEPHPGQAIVNVPSANAPEFLAAIDRLKPTTPDMPSRQWYHPTVWFYLWTGLTRGVW